MTYQERVLEAARSGRIPVDADSRFRLDVARVQRHEAREQATGVFQELRIAEPRSVTLARAALDRAFRHMAK